MSRESLARVVPFAVVCLVMAAGPAAYGVDPNELESAYWRFEEGVADSFVPAPDPGNVDQRSDVVDLSGNSNHMQAFDPGAAPKYVNYNLPPTSLASGQPNTLALEMLGGDIAGQDIFTIDRQINNGIVGGKFDHDKDGGTAPIPSTVTGFTLEASFNVFDHSEFRTIVAKEGLPGRALNSPDPVIASLPTMSLKVRGPQFVDDPDGGKLQIELFDGQGNLRSIMTDEAVNIGQWYYAAVVNDGTTLSLYLDSNNGNGYQLVGSEVVDGALFQGTDYENASWDKAWSIGKGVYGYATPNFENGIPADFFNGLIDEVRLTNEALDPEEFLFYQEIVGTDGDFNGDELVDGTDFLMWQRGDSPNGLNSGDLQDWKDNHPSAIVAGAAVPEPATLGLACLAVGAALAARRRFR
jgi:hypothetical protein